MSFFYKSLFCCFLLLINGVLLAQPTEDRVQQRLTTEADDKYDRGDLYNALNYYERALVESPRDIYLLARLAVTNYRLRDYDQAQRRYVQLMAADNQSDYPEAQFYYARCLKMNNFMEDARYHFELFLKNYKGKYPALRELASNEVLGITAGQQAIRDESVKVRHGGDKINTPFSEFNAVSADGNNVYFSALRSDTAFVKGKNASLERKNVAKVYVTTVKEGNFTDPKPIEGGINQPNDHTGNMTLSGDKNTMFFTRCQLSNNVLQHCDIFKTTRLAANEWRIGTALPQTINNFDYTAKQPAIGRWQGKEGLFFVSDKKGGFGGWDIYFAAFSGENTYDEAQNLGNSINTVGNEETPFYDSRTETLFFSSDGLPTFGGYDVFSVKPKKANAKADEKLNVTRLGRGFNSILDDLYFTTNDKGNRAYVVSNRAGSMGLHSQTCCDDIFIIELPDNYFPSDKPNSASNSDITVQVNDAKYQPMQGISVEVTAATGEKSRLRTNEMGQIILLKVEKGSFLKIKAFKDGFQSDSTTLMVGSVDSSRISLLLTPDKSVVSTTKTPPKNKVTTTTTTLLIAPIPKLPPLRKPSANKALALHNIYYDYAKSELREDAVLTLDSVAQTLKEHATLVVEIGSHTDNKGNWLVNKKLSETRSYTALQYLVQSGIAPERLIPVGYGAAKPIAPNEIDGKDNEEGRALNRRTEFRILEGRAID
jgi:outer membrane protein OmpA-like peptidoglycan-associated protein